MFSFSAQTYKNKNLEKSFWNPCKKFSYILGDYFSNFKVCNSYLKSYSFKLLKSLSQFHQTY